LRPDCRIVRFTLRELNFFAEAANLVTNKNLGWGVLLVVVPDLHSDEFFLLTCALKWWFFIFILSRICKNIWSVTNFAKIYICRRGLWRQGHNAMARGGRSRQ
jgi:hypothetical protein